MRLALEIRYLVHAMRPNLVEGSDSVILLPFFIVSNSLIIVTAVLISTRLLLVRRQIITTLGPQHAWKYISIVAMVIESASIVALVAVVYLILYALNNPVQTIFLYAIIQVTVRIAFVCPVSFAN